MRARMTQLLSQLVLSLEWLVSVLWQVVHSSSSTIASRSLLASLAANYPRCQMRGMTVATLPTVVQVKTVSTTPISHVKSYR